MQNLFSPLTIRDITLKNRIVVSPMCQYSSEDGYANDWHLVHLGSRAVGGAGLVMTEATAVTAEGRISPDDLGIWKDEHIPFLKRIVSFIEKTGSVAGMQLAHAGRKGSQTSPWKGPRGLTKEEGSWQTIAPSALAFKAGDLIPHALSTEEISEVTEAFKKAAIRALSAGFKVLEIHAAHGYLIHEFLSPVSNKREDAYGGNFENRARLLIEIVEAIRTVWPMTLPLFVRVSATEWVEDGWNENDSILLATKLITKGVDLIDCSSGGNVATAKIPIGPLYQVKLAEIIKKESGIKTGAVGLITTTEEANAIIQNNQADLVFLAREILRNPYFPLKAAKELNVSIQWPLQYERAKPADK
jgi:2,4-dienoyl-CoA reductase-like NADH-dependent reductase (Old Yellow Enzyme family)